MFYIGSKYSTWHPGSTASYTYIGKVSGRVTELARYAQVQALMSAFKLKYLSPKISRCYGYML